MLPNCDPFTRTKGSFCGNLHEQSSFLMVFPLFTAALSTPSDICQKCTKRAVRQAYHNLCNACAKEHHVCAKCSCRVERIVGRDITEVEAEQKMLQEAISNAREREKRSLLRAMNKGKSETKDKEQDPIDNPDKAGDLFKAESLEAYA
nr:hypothetical protein [Tanacetum cinerariifolium]